MREAQPRAFYFRSFAVRKNLSARNTSKVLVHFSYKPCNRPNSRNKSRFWTFNRFKTSQSVNFPTFPEDIATFTLHYNGSKSLARGLLDSKAHRLVFHRSTFQFVCRSSKACVVSVSTQASPVRTLVGKVESQFKCAPRTCSLKLT